MSDIGPVFRELERDTERISAYLRLVIVGAFVILYWTTDSPDPNSRLALALGGYAATAALGIGLAYRRYFRPWLPWLFVTLDLAVLWLLMAAPASAMGMTPVAILSLPMATLIFVMLAHAAMRYRPSLVIYAATLFMAGWLVSFLALSDGSPQGYAFQGPMRHSAAMAVPWHDTLQEVVRALMIVLTATILVVTSMRTKDRVQQSIRAARRVANLSRFMPQTLIEKLSGEDLDGGGGSRRQDAAIMFTDIRGFTRLSEHTDPAELGQFLGEFRSRLSIPITMHSGMIDKFIGDAIMVVFGTPHPSREDARNALNCALEMLDTLRRWNTERHDQGLDPVAIGIGIHYGSVFAGVLGDESRLEYTVIGDCVNVAERLEKLTKESGAPIVVSQDFLRAAGEPPDPATWQRLPIQNVRGRSGEVVAYGLKLDRPMGRE
ncbi:MAG: adenylate/guanylate cyclase domain-containing protein [Kiloniellaceae bacterium]